ncbi:MAG: hypothetical protein Q9225_005144 [Loekoesia sp. 1 TL-2023]
MSRSTLKAAEAQRLFRERDAMLDDTTDAMEDIGRSQSQQFLDLAKAFKMQVADESKAHVNNFESRVAARREDIANLINKIVDRTTLITPMLVAGNIVRSGPKATTTTQSSAQLAAESVLRLFNKLLDEYNSIDQRELTGEWPLPSVKLSGRDEKLLERLVQSQHKKAKQRINTLLQGTPDGSVTAAEGLAIESNTNKLWSSLTTEQKDNAGNIQEQERNSWHRITQSACRGIRRIVKDLPEGLEI